MKQSEPISILPFSNDQKKMVDELLNSFNEQQLSWFAGYLSGISLPKQIHTCNGLGTSNDNKQLQTPITILVGSKTNNGTAVAKKLKSAAESKGFLVRFEDMNDYSLSKLKEEKYLFVIVSTHGEGVPPIAAEEFYEFIHGKRAPKLNKTKFSVLALGDRSYAHFCKTGKDVDAKLEELGAERIFSRVDCDVDFHAVADSWINGILSKLSSPNADSSLLASKVPVAETGVHTSANKQNEVVYNKFNPFKTKLLNKIKLNGRGSQKETIHYEISLENSGINYEPGDALGIYPINSPRLVNELLNSLRLKAETEINTGQKIIPLAEALSRHYELSVITPDVLQRYNEFAQSIDLSQILNDQTKLSQYTYGRDLIDLISDYPTELKPHDLVGILRKLQPRLYSIASSLNVFPDEAHLTVTTIRYRNGRYKEGTCSSFLSDRLKDDQEFEVYLEKNQEFKLPADTDAPVIMVGPGTGIAPFRAFLQEREALGAKGKTWLFFGDRNFTDDFLYQTELLNYHKKGILNRLNVAFSRDTDKKVYVQHKMLEHSKELFSWLENGAYLYVCGDMKNMWKDVNQTLVGIIAKEGGHQIEDAQEYLKQLKKSRRYQVDVY